MPNFGAIPEMGDITNSSATADYIQFEMTTVRTAAGTEFRCSFCGKRKDDATDWLLGFEGSKEKNVVMKYAIILFGKWDVATLSATLVVVQITTFG